MLYPAELRTLTGRGERIRTFDIQLPKLARYQAALHPEKHAEFTFILFRMQDPFLKKSLFCFLVGNTDLLDRCRCAIFMALFNVNKEM
jgi:hypothetical protein